MERKGRVAGAERALGRRVEVLRGAVERAEDRVAALAVERDIGGAIAFAHEPAPKEWLAAADVAELRAGDRVLARDVHVAVRRGDRIRVTGRNGAGKTTLLGALLAGAALPPDRILYLPQETTAAEGAAVLREARRLHGAEQGRLMQLVALLGVDPDGLLASEMPSPGEARKLVLARGLAEGVWLLVADEPTNHLDLPSIERIEVALAAYPGALVVVTHDDTLARRVTSTEWEVAGGRVTVADPA
jgi:ATPase subunit of ABC transporter with duplicated ATPase domains